MMPTTAYVPSDTTALAMGVDQVALLIAREAAARNLDIEIVRNGSRGQAWLEPMVEVETTEGQVAYGPVEPETVIELVDAGLFEGQQSHPLALGRTEDIPYLKKQQRLTFYRIGITAPLSLDDCRAHQGFSGLAKALKLSPQAIVDEVKVSGLRGRGGAAFSTGMKWQTVHDEPEGQKYIVCNADEGDPYMLIEGMTIAGLAMGTTQCYVYLRSEYPVAHRRRMRKQRPQLQRRLDAVNDLFVEQIRPHLQNDGGDLHVVGLDGNQLSVHYQGACGTCPSSISGTLRGIESLVRSIEPDIEVVAV